MRTQLSILVVGVAAVALCSREPQWTRDVGGRPLLPQPEFIKFLGRSQIQLVTDLYWLRELNMAVYTVTGQEGRDLLALGTLIEALDPAFPEVYWFSALNGVPFHENKWKNAPEAADHLRRGLAQYPNNIPMAVLLAYNLWSYQGELVAASDVLMRASAIPSAPSYLAPLATRLLAAAGKFDASEQLAHELLEAAPDEETRHFFEERENAVKLERLLTTVETAAQQYLVQNGHPATSVDELVFAGFLTALPIDPFGGTILLNHHGIPYSSVRPERMHIYDHPGDIRDPRRSD